MPLLRATAQRELECYRARLVALGQLMDVTDEP